MPRYVVSLKGDASHEIEVSYPEATPEKAVRFAIAARSQKVADLQPDSVSLFSDEEHPDDRREVGCWSFVGICEGCDAVVLDPVPEPPGYVMGYASHEEGGLACAKCMEAARADEGTPTPAPAEPLAGVPEDSPSDSDLAHHLVSLLSYRPGEPAWPAERPEVTRLVSAAGIGYDALRYLWRGAFNLHRKIESLYDGRPGEVRDAGVVVPYRGPCLTKLRKILAEASVALCQAVATAEAGSAPDVSSNRALAAIEIACDEIGGLPPPGVSTGEDGWLSEEDLKGFPCPCLECAKAPAPTAEKPPVLSVQAFKWAASKTPPEELAREVFFLRSGDARREAIALGAIRRVSEWVESGADFDLVLDKQNLARPSTAPVHIERDPAFDAAELSEHWEPLDVHRDLWGVFLADDDTARPLAIFTEEVEAYDWLGFMAKHPVEDRRFGGGDKCVCVIRDLSARTWNHLSPVPSRESESSS